MPTAGGSHAAQHAKESAEEIAEQSAEQSAQREPRVRPETNPAPRRTPQRNQGRSNPRAHSNAACNQEQHDTPPSAERSTHGRREGTWQLWIPEGSGRSHESGWWPRLRRAHVRRRSSTTRRAQSVRIVAARRCCGQAGSGHGGKGDARARHGWDPR
jgi:hypothetical protein